MPATHCIHSATRLDITNGLLARKLAVFADFVVKLARGGGREIIQTKFFRIVWTISVEQYVSYDTSALERTIPHALSSCCVCVCVVVVPYGSTVLYLSCWSWSLKINFAKFSLEQPEISKRNFHGWATTFLERAMCVGATLIEILRFGP